MSVLLNKFGTLDSDVQRQAGNASPATLEEIKKIMSSGGVSVLEAAKKSAEIQEAMFNIKADNPDISREEAEKQAREDVFGKPANEGRTL